MGQTVSFSSALSSDPDGAIVAFAWDFGDGATASGATVLHAYSAAGSFTVALTVTDDRGATATASLSVSAFVPTSPPTAQISGPVSGFVSDALSFDGALSSDPDGTLVAFSWAFDDGETASGPSVSHAFSTPGTHRVSLTVTDNDGLTGEAEFFLEVVGPQLLVVPDAVVLTTTSTIARGPTVALSETLDVLSTADTLDWSASLEITNFPGFTLSQVSGVTPASVTVSVEVGEAFSGATGFGFNDMGTITFESPDPSVLPIQVPVILEVLAEPRPLSCPFVCPFAPSSGRKYCEDFEALAPGALATQAGWVALAGGTAAVVPDPRDSGQAIVVEARAGGSTADAHIIGAGSNSFSFQFRADDILPGSPEVARLELKTVPGLGFAGSSTIGVFAIGSALTYESASGVITPLLDPLTMGLFHQVRVSHAAGLLTIQIDPSDVGQPEVLVSFPLASFNLTSIEIRGLDQPGFVYFDSFLARDVMALVCDRCDAPAGLRTAELDTQAERGPPAPSAFHTTDEAAVSSDATLLSPRGVLALQKPALASLLQAASYPPTSLRFYTQDAVGNVLVVADQDGNVLEEHDYLPFGEECTQGPCARNVGLTDGQDASAASGSAGGLTSAAAPAAGAGSATGPPEVPIPGPQPRRFTGKERDAETGLDYFGARYYRANIGRFTTADPGVNLKEALVNPQKWNKYAYSLNNPLRYIDNDGQWPTAVHNNIIQMAFPGLTPAQQQGLRQASYDTDYVIAVNGRGPQDPQNSFVHSMSDGVNNQAPRDAEQQAQAFIRTQEGRAREQQAAFEGRGGEGLSNEALRSFGIGLHTVTDATSPAHAGYQPWRGTEGVGNKLAGAGHLAKEIRPTPEQLAGAVGAARASFGRAFGETRLRQAIEERQR